MSVMRFSLLVAFRGLEKLSYSALNNRFYVIVCDIQGRYRLEPCNPINIFVDPRMLSSLPMGTSFEQQRKHVIENCLFYGLWKDQARRSMLRRARCAKAILGRSQDVLPGANASLGRIIALNTTRS